jgi:hypothetical protein
MHVGYIVNFTKSSIFYLQNHYSKIFVKTALAKRQCSAEIRSRMRPSEHYKLGYLNFIQINETETYTDMS